MPGTDRKLDDGALHVFTTLTTSALFYIVDLVAGNMASGSITGPLLKAWLKSYFDTLYSAIGAGGGDGWTAAAGTPAYSSADAPSFVISFDSDVTALIGVGDRIKLTQTTVKYFIVTAIGSFSGGHTLVTVYGGTDYTLTSSAFTLLSYSHVKSPFGFPMSPVKWTVQVTDATKTSQFSPTASTWYNINGITISIPIGLWDVQYSVVGAAYKTGVTALNSFVTLSTANNSESDNEMTGYSEIDGASGALYLAGITFKRKIIALAAKTSYYLNMMTSTAAAASITFEGVNSKTIIRAICAYL